MFNKSSPITVDCDAPPYAIVRACRMIGLEDPEDVRWCRMSNARNSQDPRAALFTINAWKAFLGMDEEEGVKCGCGGGLPKLERYTFTYLSGREMHYFLAQCGRCHRVYWEPA